MASDTLTKFCKAKSDVIKELQLSVPQFTFDIREMCNGLVSDCSSILSVTSEMFEENIEIATIWSFMCGAGVRGPFKSAQDKVVDCEFESMFYLIFAPFGESCVSHALSCLGMWITMTLYDRTDVTVGDAMFPLISHDGSDGNPQP